LAVFIAPALSAKSSAETFDIAGVEDTNLTAQVNFTYDPTTGVITVIITNDTSILGGEDARLTAFAFNLPEGVTVTSFSTSHDGWNFVSRPNAIDTPGLFGFYDVAAITGPNFHGANPNFGIPPLGVFTFEFTLSGPDLDLLTEESFLDLNSYSRPRPVENVQYFIGRFQRTGKDGEGSDVAVSEPEDPENPEDPV
jgi:hypothetical protein